MTERRIEGLPKQQPRERQQAPPAPPAPRVNREGEELQDPVFMKPDRAADAGPANALWAGPAADAGWAGYGERLLAYILDSVLVTIAPTVVAVVGAWLLETTSGDRTLGEIGATTSVGLLLVILVMIVAIGYFPWFWSHGGQTPAMRLVGIRVVRDHDGGPLTGSTAVVRLIGLFASAIAFYIGFIWVFVDKRRRGWHDLIAKTVVVKDPEGNWGSDEP
jgi:uncharacterized RDD family membrane protein YckC